MKKLLLALTIVALFATASFAAASVNLETIGVLGAGALVPQTRTAGLSFVVNDNLTLGLGAGINNVSKPNDVGDVISDAAIVVGGYYKIMQSGSVSQSLGLELGLESVNVKAGTATGPIPPAGEYGNNSATYMNINGIYRVAVKLFPALTMNFDVEVLKIISDVDSTADTDVTDSSLTILNGVRIGFTVPVM